jgi:phosphatidylglycerophosphatase A
MKPSWREVLTQPDYLLALGFGSGLASTAPGTAGSLVGVLLFGGLSFLPGPVYVLVVLAGLAIGIPLCSRVATRLSVKDPACIVWDEIIGVWIALMAVPMNPWWILVGFLLFRFFDIWKPWPVSYVDRHWQGGLGIMMDDVIAGLMALMVLQGGLWVLA